MWLLAGALAGVFITALYLRLSKAHIPVKWYETLIGAIGLALLIFGLQNYISTRAEHWSEGTPLTFLLVFGLPALFLLALFTFLVLLRYFLHKRSQNAQRR